MNQKYKKITFQEAKELMDKDDSIILDVRTDEEFFTGHASGAVNFDVDTINERSASELIPDKGTPILVYCKTGERATIAAEALADLGYTKIFNIGSLVEWPFGLSFD